MHYKAALAELATMKVANVIVLDTETDWPVPDGHVAIPLDLLAPGVGPGDDLDALPDGAIPA